jgi:hypothetical protein
MASDIPTAHTPPGGYGQDFPAPILASCTEPLSKDAVCCLQQWRFNARDMNRANQLLEKWLHCFNVTLKQKAPKGQ